MMLSITSDTKFVRISIENNDADIKVWNKQEMNEIPDFSKEPRMTLSATGLTSNEIDDFLIACEDVVGTMLFEVVQDAIGMSKAFGDGQVYEWEPLEN